MSRSIFQKLSAWRMNQARMENIEDFKILQYKTMEELASLRPRTLDALMRVKGIGAKKAEKYGSQILSLVSESAVNNNPGAEEDQNVSEPLAVSEFLNRVNGTLRTLDSRIKGEVSSLNERNGHRYFSLKDKTDNSTLNCFMWQSDFELFGANIYDGLEVIVEGCPEVYKPNGRFSLRVRSIELAGEGALKKAYDQLKLQLEAEGLFSAEKKRRIPAFPERIGIITSRDGAVISDFLNNIGRHGFKLGLFDARVEGAAAVRDIMAGLTFFADKKIEVLVLMRGGGSMESMQAFNNEALARAISQFSVPVVCGIGHDKDAPLASLAADCAVSTPTAAARVLRESWEQAEGRVDILERRIVGQFDLLISQLHRRLGIWTAFASQALNQIQASLNRAFKAASGCSAKLSGWILAGKVRVDNTGQSAIKDFRSMLSQAHRQIEEHSRSVDMNSPDRQLKLGYSLVFRDGRIARSVKQIVPGDQLDLQMSDGIVRAKAL